MRCWRGTEKISRIDRVRNEVRQRVKEERNIVLTIKRWEANWIDHMLRKNCLLKHIIEVREGRGRRRKQLLHDLKEKRGYWKFKEKVLYRALWRTQFSRGHGSVIRQTTE